ncbi:MAG: hypothetical protein LBR35_01855 [Rickettsiales bacterium]|jgi:hypothetical protein|nr:hypothetical protein [Rickettsiales bacterium]
MSTILLLLFGILLFIAIFSTFQVTLDEGNVKYKSYCVSGGTFMFAVIGVFSQIFFLASPILFILAYFDFFHIKLRYQQLILSSYLFLIYLTTGFGAGALLLLLLIMPELFELMISAYKRFMGEKDMTLIFNNLDIKVKRNMYSALNIAMIFFSFAVFDSTNLCPILLICFLLNVYFYNKFSSLKI